MNYKVLFVKEAVADLSELKLYVINNFSVRIWKNTYRKIKDSINNLKNFPLNGNIPPELADLNLTQYRQVISGMNRIVYEIRQKTIYIHMVCDSRRDMKSLLDKRLLRSIDIN